MEINEKEIVEVLRNEIINNNLTCMVWQNDVCFTHEDRGVKPVVDFWSRDYLKDAIVVDKVIGKASALFMVAAGVAHAHGMVVSKLAAEVFEKSGVKYTADKIVEKITNRTGDGLCPMESAVAGVESIDEGMEIILSKIIKNN